MWETGDGCGGDGGGGAVYLFPLHLLLLYS